MAKILRAIIENVLINFRWYRRKKGGSWYKVVDTTDAGGMQGENRYWTPEPGDLPYLKEEHY